MESRNREWAHEVCRYHKPTDAQLFAYAQIRRATGDLIATILEVCPASEDKEAAIRKVREAMMTANAAIALEGRV